MVARNRRNKKGSIKSTIGYYAFTALALFLIFFFLFTNWRIYQRRADLAERVESLKAQVDAAERENKELKKNLSDKESGDYLEEAARNQLDMKKPGEDVYVVQKEQAAAENQQGEEKTSWWDKIKSIFIK